MRGDALLEALKTRIIVADGAFGTQLYAKGISPNICYDCLNIENPEIVAQIHQDYIDAGAEIIETNTFGANRNKLSAYKQDHNVRQINRRGSEIAKQYAPEGVLVAGAIGPLGRFENIEISDREKDAIFTEQAEGLMEGGVDLLILETFNSLHDLLIAVKAVKRHFDITTIAQFLLSDSGKTIEGDSALISFLKLKDTGADIIGANCGVGPRGILTAMEHDALFIDGFVSAFPNAGFPEKVDDRLIYLSKSYYLAGLARELVNAGVNIIGGCCGTTPDDIAAIKDAVHELTPVVKQPVTLEQAQRDETLRRLATYQISEGTFRKKLRTQKVISVELDPPKGLLYETVLEGARALKDAGADSISIAENPLAGVRMSNISLAHLIQKEVGIETIVHITGRDRNLIGLQSTLMGMAVEGIKNVLAVTGDPSSVGKADKIKGVFDARSYELITLLKRLNAGENYHGENIKKRCAFTIGAAFNPNTMQMEIQVKRMRKKIELGVDFFQTQPVFDTAKIDRIRELTRDIKIPILLGILPLVSSRNAEFLHNEFPGITIPDEARRRMKEAGNNGIEEGIAIAEEIIAYAYPYFKGIYIMPPFNKHEIALHLVKFIKKM